MTQSTGLENSARARIIACLFLSALIGIPRFFTVSAANLIFLEHHPATDLPYAYAASAFVIASVGFLYTGMERRIGFLRTSIWGALALALTFAATRLGYAAQGGKAVASFAMVLLAEVEFSLCTLAFWGVANRLFNVREAGKIFGVIGAGEIIPSLCGGLFLEEIVGGLGLANLFWGTVIGHAAVACALVILSRLADGVRRNDAANLQTQVSDPSHAEGSASPMRDPLFLLVSSLLFFGVVSTYWVDNAFLFSLQDQFPNQDERARFLGRFFVGLGLANLVFKFVLAHRWRGWLGGRKTLQSTPVTVLGVALLIVSFSMFVDQPKMLVWLVILLKLSERVLLESVNNPAFYSLFQAFPMQIRAQLQGKMETVVAQGATLFAGLFVLGVGTLTKMGLAQLLLLVAGVSLCWVVAAHFTWRAYVERILFALQERRLHPGFIDLESRAARSILQRGLTSTEPAKIVFSLRKLDEVNDEEMRHQLVSICEHPDTAVVDAACGTLERRGWVMEAEALAGKWARLSLAEKQKRSRWLRTMALLLPEKSRSLMLGELHDEELQNRIGACLAILQAGDSHLRARALETLAAGLRAQSPAERDAVLRALPSLRGVISADETDALYPLVLERLQGSHDETSGERAAIAAVVAFSQPLLWREVLMRLSRPQLTSSISDSLAMGGSSAEGALVQILQELPADEPSSIRGPATILLAKLGTERNLDEILAQLRMLPAFERRRVLSVLPPREFVPTSAQQNLLRELIAEERDALETIGRTWWILHDAGAPGLIVQTLWDDWKASVRTLLQLVGLFTGTHESQYIGHWWGTPVEERALALEYLETALRDSEQAWLVSFLERDEPPLPAGTEGVREGLGKRVAGPDLLALSRRYTGSRKWLPDLIQALELEASVPNKETTASPPDGVLSSIELFGQVESLWGLNTMELAALAQKAERIEMAAGELWQLPEHEGSFIACVVRGRLKLQSGPSRWSRGEGEYFGRGWMNARKLPEPAVHVAEATEPALLLCVSEKTFEEISAKEPVTSWRMLAGLAATVQGAAKSIVHEVQEANDERRGVAVRNPGPVEASVVLERTLSLRGIELFQNLDDATLFAVANAAKERYLEPGEYLCVEGDEDANLLIVLEGNSSVHRGKTMLATLEGPCTLGELGAITAAPRVATVRAETFCRVLHLERSAFYELVIRHRAMTNALRDQLMSMKKPDAETKFFSD